MPASYLEEPDEISSRMPSFGTAEQAEAFNSKFASKLAALELKGGYAAKLRAAMEQAVP